jgi:gamma-glutamyl:cysteine ligase YbdK (ATP-grasp superfamily)
MAQMLPAGFGRRCLCINPTMPSPSALTIGVEEEFQLVDPDTRELRPRAELVLPEARRALGKAVQPELYLSQVETGTEVCSRPDEVLVAALVDSGTIKEPTKLYWDVRPSSRFETLEFRVADVCATVDEAVMVAELAAATLARGSGAARQRRTYERRGRLADVVDQLVAETARGGSQVAPGRCADRHAGR